MRCLELTVAWSRVLFRGRVEKRDEGARGLVRNRYMMTMTMICNQRLWVLLLMLYFVAWVFILLFFLF